MNFLECLLLISWKVAWDHPHITDDTLFKNYFDSSSGFSGEDELPVSADELYDYFSNV